MRKVGIKVLSLYFIKGLILPVTLLFLPENKKSSLILKNAPQ